MKRSVKDMLGFTLGATDGEIGKVKDLYFDDHTWTIRYLVVETGSWLSGRKVLIATEALTNVDWENEVFPVNLTKEQIKNSPDIDTEKPVSRQEEMQLYQYYPWTNYWAGGLWAGGIGTTGMVTSGLHMPLEDAVHNENKEGNEQEQGNPNLRSTENVTGYYIRASDDTIGDVEDFIVEDTTWKIEYMVVDTGNWFPGKKVLVSPQWIKEVAWETSSVTVSITKEQVKNSPEYHHGEPITDDYHNNLHKHYGQ